MTPFYLDWTFWSFVVAGFALALSQLPPVVSWFKGPQVDIEVYNRTHLTHKVGNPNAQLHLAITNTGGRELKVTGMSLQFSRGDEDQFTLLGQNYVVSSSDKSTVLLTRFSLKPNEEWAYLVNFLNYFSRAEEKQYRQLESNLKNDIFQRRQALGNKQKLVEADEQYVKPFLEFFHRKFKWHPGEYMLTLKINTKPQSASIERRYRITLFESDSFELKDYAEDYKYGAGIYWEYERHTGVILPLTEA